VSQNIIIPGLEGGPTVLYGTGPDSQILQGTQGHGLHFPAKSGGGRFQLCSVGERASGEEGKAGLRAVLFIIRKEYVVVCNFGKIEGVKNVVMFRTRC